MMKQAVKRNNKAWKAWHNQQGHVYHFQFLILLFQV